MRNYIYTAFQQVNLHGDDGSGGTIDVTATAVGGDPNELSENLLVSIALAKETNDPAHIYTWTETDNAPVVVYFLLDKTNVITFLNSLADFFYFAVVANVAPPYFGIFKPQIKADADFRPRKGWKDVLGKLRAPTPSDETSITQAGASSDLGIPEALANLVQVFRSKGQLREAGIVQFALDRIMDGQMTIIEAIAYLEKNGIFSA